MGEFYKLLLENFRLPPQKFATSWCRNEQNILTPELPICLSLMNTVVFHSIKKARVSRL